MNYYEIIKQKLSIEDVIGGYIKLESAGANWKARCPFHTEKTASFLITPSRGMFYCFGCHKGGDIFQFVQDIERISSREALQKLADQAGVALDNNYTKTDTHKTIVALLDVAVRYYHACLRKNPVALAYLSERGLAKETIVKFNIGFSPGYQNLIDVLIKNKFSREDIVASGIGVMGTRGLYDRFSGRIMFPTRDSQGRYVAFSARLLPGDARSDRAGKYINSPETALYHKSQVLFGYTEARTAILEKKYALVVEGHMDVIMLHQAGFTETVGVSGTACTADHIRLLHRVTDHVVVAFDYDAAGQKALDRLAPLCISQGIRVSVITFPEKDPADSIQNDPAAWQGYLEAQKDYFQICLERVQSVSTVERRVAMIKEIIFPILQVIPETVIRNAKLEYIARGLSWSVDDLHKDYRAYIAKDGSPHAVPAESHTIPAETSPHTDIEKLLPDERMLWEIACFETIYGPTHPELVGRLETYASHPWYADRSRYMTSEHLAYYAHTMRHVEESKLHEHFTSLADQLELFITERDYRDCMSRLRNFESGQVNDQTYNTILEEGGQLLARIHTLRGTMHQSL